MEDLGVIMPCESEIQVKVHKICDMHIYQQDFITEELLFDIFLKNVYETVYIVKEENGRRILCGIITIGDFRGHYFEGLELINKNFTKILVGEEYKARELFETKSNINTIPITSENGELLKEYYRIPKENTRIKNVIRLVDECLLWRKYYAAIIVIVNDEVYQEEKLKSICESNGVILKHSLLPKEIEEYLKKGEIYIIDLCNGQQIRELLYDKYDIEFACGMACEDDTEVYEKIRDLSKHFTRIGVLNQSEASVKDVLNGQNEVYEIDIEKCIWNSEQACYECCEEVNADIECVLTFLWPVKSHQVIINRKKVIAIGISDWYYNSIELISVGDIYNNILPRFDEYGIKYIIIKNFHKINGIFEENCFTGSGRKKNLSLHSDKIVPVNNFRDELLASGQFDEFSKFVGSDCPKMLDEIMESGTVSEERGYLRVIDHKGKWVNIINGERYTCGNPEIFVNTIYLFGPCFVQGSMVVDSNSLGSAMRPYINSNYYIKNCGSPPSTEMNNMIRDEVYQKGDIVVMFPMYTGLFEENGIQTYSIVDVLKTINDIDRHIWKGELHHFDKVVTQKIAEKLVKILGGVLEYNTDTALSSELLRFSHTEGNYKPVYKWLDNVIKYKRETSKAGCIVMNCNPFTLGHRYLIDYARKKVDVLYVFVVEENKSYFPFADRLQMVKIGVADCDNVVVIPSGKYIISTETLPGYFEKESNPYVEFDATDDLKIFSTVIAPKFGISVRFAGNEPNDKFTRQYNQAMRRTLPRYGIAFDEIPRKQINDEVISASTVRKCIENKDYQKLKKLVLPDIYDYLYKNFSFED